MFVCISNVNRLIIYHRRKISRNQLTFKELNIKGHIFRLQIARQAKGINGESEYFEHPFVQV